jgi:hypothetical protein
MTEKERTEELTSADIVWLIRRYNFGRCLFGTIFLFFAFVFWFLTAYIMMDCLVVVVSPNEFRNVWFTPWQCLGIGERVFLSLFLIGIAIFERVNSSLFFANRHDENFPVIRPQSDLIFAVPSMATIPLLLLCLAPILTVLSFTTFRQCLSSPSEQRTLACSLHCYLKQKSEWVSYPKLESQRQAILLLYRLGLIRISHRFGSLQIKYL